MKLVVLDGHALNPGDVSWDGISALADEFMVYDRTPPDLVAERIGNADAILLNKVRITKEILSACPNLRYIGVLATGYNVVDVASCAEAGIVVTNIPSYSTDAVAQHIFALILHFASRVGEHSDSVARGDWIKCPDFCYWVSPLSEISGKTLGIFGFGNIGRKVAQIAHAFGMNVIIHVHSPSSFTGGEKSVSVDELFSESDYLALAAPLTPETEKIVSERTLSLMKRSAVLVNTARGGLVDERAVRAALDSGALSGYAADVLLSEPMDVASPLAGAPRCVITPHVAWAAKETRERLLGIARENIKSFLAGSPVNVVR